MGAHLRPGQSYQDIDPPRFPPFLAARSPGHERFISHAHRRQRLYKDMGRAALHRGIVASCAISPASYSRWPSPSTPPKSSVKSPLRANHPRWRPFFGARPTDADANTRAASSIDDGASPLSAHRGSCAPSPAYGAPLSQATPSNHPAWSPIPCRGRRGRSLRASRARTASLPGAGRRAGFESSSSLTFENFVIGESNRMAYPMAVEVAESPGRLPLNPLFIYGKSGLGKTHLMRAIQNYIEETRPSMRTVYVGCSGLCLEVLRGRRHQGPGEGQLPQLPRLL